MRNNSYSYEGPFKYYVSMFLTFFRPTHPYQQTSEFPYTHHKHDVSISSYPPTYIFFFSLINKAKFGKKMLIKKVPHKKVHYFLCMQRKVFSFYIFFLFFAHVSIWTPPPTHLVSKRQYLATRTHPPLCWHNTWMVSNSLLHRGLHLLSIQERFVRAGCDGAYMGKI